MLNRRQLLKSAAVAGPAMLLARGADAAAETVATNAVAPSNGFSDFPALFKGPVVRPTDPAYAQVKQLWNSRGAGQMPGLIARAASADDVQTAVRYAISKDIPVAVRGGGHGIECFAMPDKALVIDTSMMNDVKVNPATGAVTVQAGVKLGAMTVESEKHGWIVPAGTVSSVGAAGLTLGGGIGHLTRRFGATVDNVLSMDLVTMDGRKLTASKKENKELFWGMCGAGQNLAIATSITFQGHRLESIITRSMIFAPGDAQAVLAGLHDVMARSPRELTITPIVQKAAPLPGMPPELVGKVIILASVVYTGPAAKFEAAMAEARKLPKPMMEFPGPSTWAELTTTIDKWMPAGRRWYNGGGCIARLTDEFGRLAIEAVQAAPEGCELHIPITGGAMHDFAEDSAAFSRAGSDWMYEITAQWDGAASDDEYMSWVDTTGKSLAPHTLRNGYINLNPYHGPASVPALYGSPEKWARIVALKQKWDPQNRLRFNKNIRAVG